MTLFASVQLAPKDPIFGLTEAFVADQRPDKVNLGVGVYYTDEGKVPLLRAVIEAEEGIVAKHSPRSYIPIEGPNPYNSAVQNLLFGADSALIKDSRVVTAECLGGTGALRVGADFIKRLDLNAPCAISNPTWENHRGIFESAGFDVVEYTYFDGKTRGVDFDGMVKSLESFPKNTTVLLHACCHNPTGADITEAQWRQVIEICKAKGFIPFLDMAYQGFASGIEQDGVAGDLAFLIVKPGVNISQIIHIESFVTSPQLDSILTIFAKRSVQDMFNLKPKIYLNKEDKELLKLAESNKLSNQSSEELSIEVSKDLGKKLLSSS
jgi:aromatic-amino-acid transaminase